jgi:hypothetical protein
MKKIFLLGFVTIVSTLSFAQSVGIGNSSPAASAMLDISSTTKGLLIPRMTTGQRTGITSPATGLMVYDVTTNSFWYYNGSAWASVAGSVALSLPYYSAVNTADTAFHIKNSGAPALAGEGTNTTGVAGLSNSGHGMEGTSVSGHGVYGNSFSGHGINAYSFNGNGVMANSTNGYAVYGFSNNANATIYGSNSNGLGVGVQGNASLHHGVLGTSAGTNKAGVRGEANGASGIGVYGTTSSDVGYGVQGFNNNGVAVFGTSNSGTGVRAFSSSGLALDVVGKLKISGANTNPSYGAVLTSDASGNATWINNRVAFSTTGMNLNFQIIANNFHTKFHFSNEPFDLGADFVLFTGTNPANTSSSFIAPTSGIYHFDASGNVSASGSQVFENGSIRIRVKRGASEFTAAIETMIIYTDLFGSSMHGRISRDIQLQAGDQVYLELYQDNDQNGTANLAGATMNGRLVIAD